MSYDSNRTHLAGPASFNVVHENNAQGEHNSRGEHNPSFNAAHENNAQGEHNAQGKVHCAHYSAILMQHIKSCVLLMEQLFKYYGAHSLCQAL
jgi:hypothetical protein